MDNLKNEIEELDKEIEKKEKEIISKTASDNLAQTKESTFNLLNVFKDFRDNLLSFFNKSVIDKTLGYYFSSIEILAKVKDSISEVRDILAKQTLKVEITNQQELPKEVTIKNLKEIPQIKIPEEFKIEKPKWLGDYFEQIFKVVTNPIRELLLKQLQNVNLTGPRDPTKPIAVRLSDGKRFYEAIASFISGSSGGGSPFRKANGVADDALIDNDRHLQIDIESSALPTGAATSANQTNGSQQSKIKETIPTDATKNNSSLAFTRNADNYVTSIAQIISAVTYTKTITRDANNYITAISTWS